MNTDTTNDKENTSGKGVASSDMLEVNAEMLAALKLVRSIIVEGAHTGFNCHSGDWAERLFRSQHDTFMAVDEAEKLLSSNNQ